MKSIDIVIKSIVDILEEEIKLRKELGSKMVGLLYPNIVQDEIIKLNSILNKVKYDT